MRKETVRENDRGGKERREDYSEGEERQMQIAMSSYCDRPRLQGVEIWLAIVPGIVESRTICRAVGTPRDIGTKRALDVNADPKRRYRKGSQVIRPEWPVDLVCVE